MEIKRPRVLCFGDSNTWGYDPRSYFGSRYARDVRWTGILEGRGFTVINDGVNGRAFPRVEELPGIAAMICRGMPWDAVLILLGTNDMLLGRTAEETGARADSMLGAVCSAVPPSRVFLIAPPALRRGEWAQEESVLRESRLLPSSLRASAARSGVCFLDASKWDISLAFDGVHFSAEGHRVFAERITAALRPGFPL